MKLIDNALHVSVEDLVTSGCNGEKINDYTSRGYASLPFIKVKGRKFLPFEKLGCRYKEAIIEKFGNPYEYILKEPIKQFVKYDMEAERYFLQTSVKGIYSLSEDQVFKLAQQASWLNMLRDNWDKRSLKENLNMRVDQFLNNVIDLIKINNIQLPTSTKRLKEKLEKYIESGYPSLIHGHTGKISNAAKVKDEVSEAHLLSLIEHPNQYDDVFVCWLYNEWAKENNYAEITPATVGNWRREKEPEITIGRYGNNRFNEKYIRQVKGSKPTAPCLLWESDDNNLDFYFNSDDSNYNKYVSYVVIDSYCGLVLGKSYRLGRSPVVEMVRLAYIDAMYYVRSLTGGWHLPFEIKTDHWQEKSVFPFFQSLANFVPPAHFNKHRGYIEQFFGSKFSQRCKKIDADNYNGNNITAKNIGINTEALYLNKKQFPLVGNEAETQIERCFELMRCMPDIKREDMHAPSKKDKWLAKWNTLTDEQKRPISDEQFLMKFGFKHQPQGRQITICNRGVEPQINGVKYSYDLPDYLDMMPLIGEQVNVIYDPYDMSRVLITNGKNIRHVCRSAQFHPRALHDTTVNSRTMLNMVLSEKAQQTVKVANKATQRKIIVTDNFDEKALQLSGYMPKEMRNEVEQHYLNVTTNADFEKQRMEYLDGQFDPSYLD